MLFVHAVDTYQLSAHSQDRGETARYQDERCWMRARHLGPLFTISDALSVHIRDDGWLRCHGRGYTRPDRPLRNHTREIDSRECWDGASGGACTVACGSALILRARRIRRVYWSFHVDRIPSLLFTWDTPSPHATSSSRNPAVLLVWGQRCEFWFM
jgi:hypothetical protein